MQQIWNALRLFITSSFLWVRNSGVSIGSFSVLGFLKLQSDDSQGVSPKAFTYLSWRENSEQLPVSVLVSLQHPQHGGSGPLDLFQDSKVEPDRSWIFLWGWDLVLEDTTSLTYFGSQHWKSWKTKSQLQGKGTQTPPLAGRSISHSGRTACVIGYICILNQSEAGLHWKPEVQFSRPSLWGTSASLIGFEFYFQERQLVLFVDIVTMSCVQAVYYI